MEANNMKEMRDALKVIRRMVNEELEDLKDISDEVRMDFISIRGWCDHAFTKSPRACDVMSQEDLTRVVINGFMKSLGIGQENQLVSQLAEAAISAAIKCAYDTQLVVKKGGAN